MNIKDMKVTEMTDVIAVVAVAIGLFLAIAMEQKDLTLLLGGTLGGVIGISGKNKRGE